MWKPIGIGIEVITFFVFALLAVRWAITQDGWFEPYTVLCGLVAAALELIRRYIVRESSANNAEIPDDNEVANVKKFGAGYSDLIEKNRGYILAQHVTLARITDLESWKRAQVDGTLKQFAVLCNARNSFMASPDAVGLMGSMSKVSNFIASIPVEPTEEDLMQLAAHKKWSELTSKLGRTGPRSDAEVKNWLELSRKFLDSCLTATAAKDHRMKNMVKTWVDENKK